MNYVCKFSGKSTIKIRDPWITGRIKIPDTHVAKPGTITPRWVFLKGAGAGYFSIFNKII